MVDATPVGAGALDDHQSVRRPLPDGRSCRLARRAAEAVDLPRRPVRLHMLPQAGFRRLTWGMRMPTSWRNRLWSFTVPGAIALAGVCLVAPVYRLQGLPWAQAVAAALMVAVPGIALGWGV